MISLEEAKKLGEGYKVVPVSREILSDIRTPIEVLRILKGSADTATCWRAWSIRRDGDDTHSSDTIPSWKLPA